MQQPIEIIHSPALSLKELAGVLIKHFDYHEGLYAASFQLQLGVGAIGMSPETQLPGAIVGIAGVSIAKATETGPNTVDAAEVNPPAGGSKSRSPSRPVKIKRAEERAKVGATRPG